MGHQMAPREPSDIARIGTFGPSGNCWWMSDPFKQEDIVEGKRLEERDNVTAASAAYLNQAVERTAHLARFLGVFVSHPGWAAAHRQR
jgi:hypothetical protein